jgi:hypothetical protein
MGPFSWLLRMTTEAVWPFYAVAVATLIGVTAYWRRVPSPEPRPPVRMLGALLIAPLALTVWASVTYRAESAGGRPWASIVLTTLAIGILIFIVWMTWRWRTRMPVVLPVAVAAAAATFVAWFIGVMAIVDDWV